MPKPHSTGGRNFLQKAIFEGAGLPCMRSTLALQTVFAAAPEAAPNTRRQGVAEWVIKRCYRMSVVVDSGADSRVQTPVSVHLDFAEIFKSHGIRGRLDQKMAERIRSSPENPAGCPSRRLSRKGAFRIRTLAALKPGRSTRS